MNIQCELKQPHKGKLAVQNIFAGICSNVILIKHIPTRSLKLYNGIRVEMKTQDAPAFIGLEPYKIENFLTPYMGFIFDNSKNFQIYEIPFSNLLIQNDLSTCKLGMDVFDSKLMRISIGLINSESIKGVLQLRNIWVILISLFAEMTLIIFALLFNFQYFLNTLISICQILILIQV